ncbi:MAG: sigma-54 dependent transcriptional regulator, partial [Myxococcota bacterium]
LGESGTGKELVARAIHQCSVRQHHPFRALNCGAIPETLLESELFGFEKGAFSGAVQTRAGAFEQAGEGTLFLDEIGDLPLHQQVTFLRVLEVSTFRRVGGQKDLPCRARLVAATHRDLVASVREGRFRGDLYHRISVLPIVLPPLRQRPEDIPLLVRYFLRTFGKNREVKVSQEALEVMQRYSWPGNIRELRNAIQRALVMVEGTWIQPEDLMLQPLATDAIPSVSAPVVSTSSSHPAADSPVSSSSASVSSISASSHGAVQDTHNHSTSTPLSMADSDLGAKDSLEQVERAAIIHALEQSQGVVSDAARRLGISRSSLYHKMKRHQIQPHKYK